MHPRSRSALVPGGVARRQSATSATSSHGAYAEVARERLDAKAGEVFDALRADAPLRDLDGGLPAADGGAREAGGRWRCVGSTT